MSCIWKRSSKQLQVEATFKQAAATRDRSHMVLQLAVCVLSTCFPPSSLQVEAEFKQAEAAAVLNEQRAAQEVELEEEEQRLARSVGLSVHCGACGALRSCAARCAPAQLLMGGPWAPLRS